MDTRATDPTLTRRAGVLAHVSSLPGPRYCGDFGFAASNFFEWCRAAELRLWQVLPLGPTGRGHSPYSATSAFACNPTWFAQRGSPAGEEAARFDRCDLPRASRDRRRRLEESWRAFERDASSDRRVACESFRHSEEREFWLEDWTLYAALKEHHGERPWFEWDPELRRREPAALREAARELDERRRFHGWVQFELDRQARSVRASAEAHDIVWIGDLPFTVALDSADVWARREFFRVDDDGRPEVTAGVPPDAFSDAGQCWNTPLFDWIAMEQDGFAWWLARCRAALRWVHALRLDHFRGYAASWEIPFGAETAAAGRWQAVPGDALFEAVRGAGLDRRLFAEDLGDITPDVTALRDRYGFPGLHVLQFGLTDPSSTHHPERHRTTAVACTGTHDTDTFNGWFESVGAAGRETAGGLLGAASTPARAAVEICWASPANWAIAPLQDLLELGSDSRMNRPGESQGQWAWRCKPDQLDGQRAAWLAGLARRHERS